MQCNIGRSSPSPQHTSKSAYPLISASTTFGPLKMDIASIIAYLSLLMLSLLSYTFINQRNKMIHKSPKNKSKNLQHPPGSMGLPYVGDTLHLYSQDPNLFFAEKQKRSKLYHFISKKDHKFHYLRSNWWWVLWNFYCRYGDVFKSHILGYPSVMLASPEASRFVLMTNEHMFKPTYPKSKELLIGSYALFFHQGHYHQNLRKIVQDSISGPRRMCSLIPLIEDIAVSSLDCFSHVSLINTFNAMKMVNCRLFRVLVFLRFIVSICGWLIFLIFFQYAFDVGVLSIFGHLNCALKDELKRNYKLVEKGYNCFPLHIPGTAYHTATLVLNFTFFMIIHSYNSLRQL